MTADAGGHRPLPRMFRTLEQDALRIDETPFGAVGLLHCGDGVEAVWVSKAHEPIDPDWFGSDHDNVLVVVSGSLRVEFEAAQAPDRVLGTGDVLVLPAGQRCRAYRWPRDSDEAAVFVALHPSGARFQRAP